MLTVIRLPSLSSTMKKGKVVKWHKKEGEYVRKGEILFEVETDKVVVEVESLTSGFLRKILVPEKAEAPVHTAIAIFSERMDEDIASVVEAGSSAAPSTHEKEPVPSEEKGARRKISPLARKIASEAGIDIQSVRGTGPGGRITREDVEKAMEERSGVAATLVRAEEKQEQQPEMPAYEDLEVTAMRKIVARRLQESKSTAPHFYVDLTADATALMELKEKLERAGEEAGGKISLNDIMVKIVAHGLKEFPMVNASFLGDRIRLHKRVHIGVAVAVEDGLLVPVILDADRKSIRQIGDETRELVGKARNRKLLPHEYEGGTFTISNMGMFGVEGFHAILNPPEGAILAVGAVIPKPVVVEGKIRVRPCFRLSLSVDHRVVDGALAARFLARVKALLETPSLILA
ncbi:MAG: 2-oxo acid dehydrogenase subunit E2 [Deltaproteobacteria bacterium]|nr:2-oxo acid dehydrogenase subunit E2 [Deltaproteobacteria bacterium]